MNMSILTPKSSQKYDPGCSSRILIPDPDLDYFTQPGSRGEKGTGSRIRNTVGTPNCSVLLPMSEAAAVPVTTPNGIVRWDSKRGIVSLLIGNKYYSAYYIRQI
jgi:hypothetical protein